MWSALATELLRLSGILRDRGEAGDAERLSVATKELKGEIAKNWLGRAGEEDPLLAVLAAEGRPRSAHTP